MTGPRVYFIQRGDDGPIKIGATDGNPRRRRAQMQPGCPERLTVLGTINGDRELERSLHQQFQTLRLGGEWFRASPELVEFIRRHAEPLPPQTGRGRGRPRRTEALLRLPVYGSADELALARRLAERWGCSMAEAFRRAVRQAAKREKVG